MRGGERLDPMITDSLKRILDEAQPDIPAAGLADAGSSHGFPSARRASARGGWGQRWHGPPGPVPEDEEVRGG
jgi:hypothetical protein